MNVTALIDTLRQDLARAADLGGPETKSAAERLVLALDPALRLTLMDALSQAATEISDALAGVTIDVRLRGRELEFVVEGAPVAVVAPADQPFETDDGEAIRITLRLPDGLKARAEALAARRGQSLNTWLVAAARAAADTPSSPGPGHRPGQRLQGWAR